MERKRQQMATEGQIHRMSPWDAAADKPLGVKVKDLDGDSVYSDQCDVLISATGFLNEWKWPNIPGLHDFKGKLMHSARWDESYDYSVC